MMKFFRNDPMSGRQGRRTGGRDRGFALIEVVIAIALVGVTFAVIMEAFSQSLRVIDQVDVQNIALQLAQNKMNELLIDDEIFTDQVLEGEWNADFSWRAQLETHEIDDLTVDKNRLSTRLLYIRLTVNYRYGGRTRGIKLFTIKLVPKPEIGERGRLGGGRR